MTLSNKKRWVDFIVFGLSVFLLFCLLFESYIKLPILVSWLGQWHPLILHFPIVLLIIAVFCNLTQNNVPRLLLTVATISALVTAITGFLLGIGAESKGYFLFWHQWMGTGVAIIASLWYWLDAKKYGQHKSVKALQIGLVILIGFTGHYGGTITHGEDFLALPKDNTQEKIPENPLIYDHIVDRILTNKCVACHNSNKQKGQLLLTNLKGLMKGGKSGKAILPGKPDESELIVRLDLPKEDEHHMPPEGEKQLSNDEIEILKQWITLGASNTLRLDELVSGQPLAVLVKEMMQPDPMEKWVQLPMVEDSTIHNLSSDYVTIKRLAGSSNALRVNVYEPPIYNAQLIMSLRPIANNIVELDISGLPIGKNEIGLVAACNNLEWLEIDKTPVTDIEIDTLKTLSKLRMLKIYETKITDKSIEMFKELGKLKNIYVWETLISNDALNELKELRPGLSINNGIDPEIKSFFITVDSIPKELY